MIPEPRCYARRCRHFTGVVGEDEAQQHVTCAAFPDGIPEDIAYGDNKHLTPYPNDNGIRYERE